MTKKNIEKALAKRQEIKSRIQEITIQLNRPSDVQQLGIASGEALTRASSFLNRHGNGNESNIPEGKKSEYRTLKADAEKKKSAYLPAKQKNDFLRTELAELKAELENLGRCATAADVKKYQDEAVGIENHIEELRQAILRETEKIFPSKIRSMELDSLYRDREDLMADLALGAPGDKSRLAEIETLITQEEARINEVKKAEASAGIVLAGLKRKVADAEQSLDRVRETLQTVYCDFLISQAEEEGAKFVELSGELWGQFSRLIALGTMIEKHPSANGMSIISAECRSFKIPSFILKSCPSGLQNKGFLRMFNQLDINTEVDSTKRNIAELGIN